MRLFRQDVSLVSSIIRNRSSRFKLVAFKCHNNNNIVICKVHKVSSNAELESPAVTWWAALVGYVKRTVLRRRL